MSYISSLNKKNLKLKNISFISPITYSKLNISNLIAETQRIISTSTKNKINTPQQISNTNLNSPKTQIYSNKQNQILNDLYRSYSTNRPNSNKVIIKKKIKNKKIQNLNRSTSNNNNNNKIKTSPSPSAMLTTFANFAQNLNKNKNPLFSNIGIKSNNNRRNPQSNIEIRYFKKVGLTSNNSLSNINNSNNDNLTNNNNSYFNHSNFQYNNNTEYNKKKTNRKINEINLFKDKIDKKDNYSIPLSPCSNNNNMNILIRQIYKRNDNYNNNNNNDSNDNNFNKNNIKNNIQTQSQQSENSQNILLTTQSSIGKKKKKKSHNSSKNEGENKNKNIINKNIQNNINNIITMNIDTPEELHFFYINILQNGKKMESKFEITNSINP